MHLQPCCFLTSCAYTNRDRDKVRFECGRIATCRRWADYWKSCIHIHRSAVRLPRSPLWFCMLRKKWPRVNRCWMWNDSAWGFIFLMFAFFRLSPRWRWKLKRAIVTWKWVEGGGWKPQEFVGWGAEGVVQQCGRFDWPSFSEMPGKCSKLLRRKCPLALFLIFDWPLQSRGSHESIRHSTPCWLHTALVPQASPVLYLLPVSERWTPRIQQKVCQGSCGAHDEMRTVSNWHR